MNSLGKAVLKGAVGLGIFAVVTAGLIAITKVTTADRIVAAQKKAQAKALLEIVPANEHDNDLLSSIVVLAPDPLLGLAMESQAYVATQQGNPVAVILPFTVADGYTGDISGIVGIKPDGTIKGVRITQHKETPGLGDKIEARKSSWLDGFISKSLDNPIIDRWKVKKDGGDFDQLTGATITPRAVVGGVKNTLIYFKQHHTRLFHPSPQPIAMEDL